jgi:hypothetical protein
MLVERLSYTHLELLTGIADPLKRAFNELRFDRAREEDAGGARDPYRMAGARPE